MSKYLWPTAEQELILTAAIGPDRCAIEAFQQWDQSTDYAKDFDNGVFRLLPLVYRRMQSLGVTAAAMPRLKGVYRYSWCETQLLFQQAAPALARLREQDIEILLLKGAPLLNVYYKGTGLRPMGDIDIVVRRGDLGKAISILRDAGWTPPPGVTPRSDLPLAHLKFHHAIQFSNQGGQEIDLHHHFLQDAFNGSADAWFWDASIPFEFMGLQTQRLDATALLLHTVIHGIRPNPFPTIRWIADAHAVLAQAEHEIRWVDIIAFAAAQSLSHRLYLGLSYIADRFGAPIPGFVLDRLGAAKFGFAEWAEQKFLFEVERPQSFLGWICIALADDVRRSKDKGRMEFIARVVARIRRRVGLKLRSVLARAAG